MKKKITINYKGVDLDIEYLFQPEEKAETGPEAQYPGCGADIEEVSEIKHKGTCLLKLLEYDIDGIEEAIKLTKLLTEIQVVYNNN